MRIDGRSVYGEGVRRYDVRKLRGKQLEYPAVHRVGGQVLLGDLVNLDPRTAGTIGST